MPVKISEIRQKLIFTAGMRLLSIERLDLLPESEIAITVEMRNARRKLHEELEPTALWTYDGLYPGKVI